MEGMQVAEVKLSYTTKVKASDRKKTTGALDSYNILRPFFEEYIEYREVAFAMLLNKANKVLGVIKLSEGGVSSTIIDSRLLYQAAILANASCIILAHNHPSGELQPSSQDRELTSKIKKAGELFNIDVLDHLIITEEGYFSFAEKGLM